MKIAQFFYKHAGLGSLLATATNAAAIFLVFRMAYRDLGGAIVGIWALIQSVMVVSRIGDSGSGGNITRLVAIDRRKQGGVKLRNFIITGLLIGTAPIAVLGLAIFAPILYYMTANYGNVIPLAPLTGLIACSLVFGMFNSVALILSGCLDGMGLMTLRGCLSSISNIFCVIFGYFFIHTMGDLGLGLTYVAYAVFLTAILGIGVWLFRPATGTTYRPHPVGELVRKSVTFNVNFLFISLIKLLLDPICKILIGRFSTLEMVAIFDLANKFASQIVVLFSSAFQSLLPAASRETRNIEAEKHVDALARTKLAVRWAFCVMTLLVLFSGYLSRFTLGHVSIPFIQMQMILAFGGAINIVGLVGYYLEVGSGHLKRLVAVFAGCAFINLIAGFLLGTLLGAVGVTLASAAAWVFGGLACARPLFGSALQLCRFLISSVAPELLLFALAAGLVGYMVADANHVSDWMRLAATIASSLFTIGIFLCRDGAKFLWQYYRLNWSGDGAAAVAAPCEANSRE